MVLALKFKEPNRSTRSYMRMPFDVFGAVERRVRRAITS